LPWNAAANNTKSDQPFGNISPHVQYFFFHCSEMQQQIKLNSDAQPFGKIDSHMQCAANFMPRSQGISLTT